MKSPCCGVRMVRLHENSLSPAFDLHERFARNFKCAYMPGMCLPRHYASTINYKNTIELHGMGEGGWRAGAGTECVPGGDAAECPDPDASDAENCVEKFCDDAGACGFRPAPDGASCGAQGLGECCCGGFCSKPDALCEYDDDGAAYCYGYGDYSSDCGYTICRPEYCQVLPLGGSFPCNFEFGDFGDSPRGICDGIYCEDGKCDAAFFAEGNPICGAPPADPCMEWGCDSAPSPILSMQWSQACAYNCVVMG